MQTLTIYNIQIFDRWAANRLNESVCKILGLWVRKFVGLRSFICRSLDLWIRKLISPRVFVFGG
jgi:hypothetical protein